MTERPASKKSRRTQAAPSPRTSRWGDWRRWLTWRVALRTLGGLLGAMVVWVGIFAWIDPPQGLYMRSEAARLGAPIRQDWVPLDRIAPVMARSAVAAEDANYCLHWGFDMAAIRLAMDGGGSRGASTISQQVVKNVFLWHRRSWPRKALEAMLTPIMETLWSKERILEVYLNVAEFDAGIFGVQAAARHYFGVDADRLSELQAARLAMVLPNPQQRSASRPTDVQRKRTARIIDGAQTIAADGRARCFQPRGS